jgi:NAD(P)-dependent dehydrogenase (short-subunit alcohol dehydrogenase family)
VVRNGIGFSNVTEGRDITNYALVIELSQLSEENINQDESGRVAVITGSSKGIGKASALEFANKGHKVVLNLRDERELSVLNDVRKSLEGNEELVTYLAGDRSQENVCTSLIDHTIKTFGRIDLLVNKSGIGGTQKHMVEFTTADWDYYAIHVNLK